MATLSAKAGGSRVACLIMRYAILINAAPHTQQSAQTAWQFTQTALSLGHQIDPIFFYQDGVHTANKLIQMPADEFHLPKAWLELAKQHALNLITCVSAGLKRGVIAETEASSDKVANLLQEFSSLGLSQWVSGMLTADRVIVFGN